MNAYNITNPLKNQLPITKILTNYGVNKNESLIINPPNEEQFVSEIYSALKKKNYDLLSSILDRLPNFKKITTLFNSLVQELQKNDYTMSQLMAISTLLYRLSNIRFVSVILPKEFPNHSQADISNIYKNKQLNQY